MATVSNFQQFTAKFPAVQMPVTLGEDTHHVFSKENEPLTAAMITEFILPTETTQIDDEFTEYIPCFSIEDTGQFVALVWWKATLLRYEYVLTTFSKEGQLIGSEVIGGTVISPEKKVFRAVTTINEDWEIAIAEGVSPDGNQVFDPTTSHIRHMEIMVNGEIVLG